MQAVKQILKYLLRLRYVKVLVFLTLFLSFRTLAQECSLVLKGQVLDASSNIPLEFVNVYIEDIAYGTATDSLGLFYFKSICPQGYHLQFSHLGCESQTIFIELSHDTSLTIKMEHTLNVLDGITVIGIFSRSSTQVEDVLNQQSITDQANKNLANMLENIAGVRTLKNGNGIAKPIIHGLFGNRITILNNGIAQSGQQWGNDHSPEIDPLIANNIRVLKGVSSLKYPGSSLGSLILVEPKAIDREPHLHTKMTYFFESNGLSQGLNFQFQQYSPLIAWKLNTTLKKVGDRKTATYFLRNTGNQEANLALQLEKKISNKIYSELYFSTFNSELGVLRGSHIGNLTDLELAFSRSQPFFTEQKFSYTIDAPKQIVQHHLLKIRTEYLIDNRQSLDFTLAAQSNFRREFDIRRGNRTNKPALSLSQLTYFGQAQYEREFKTATLNTGFQFNRIDNTNNPGTGILPLIPDYIAYESGVFMTYSKKHRKWLFELGARYDNVIQNVATISRSIPRIIIRYNNDFHNFSTSTGLRLQFTDQLKLTYNLGYATRNPAINELYSFGLHQGVSGIEQGNPQLQSEQSLKMTFDFEGHWTQKTSFKAIFYYQNIANYIVLTPQKEIRLTIRGAFPVFEYEQTQVHIYGFDLSTQVVLKPKLNLTLAYNFIRGEDWAAKKPLINVPSNIITSSLGYKLPSLKIGQKETESIEFKINTRYIFKQSHLLEDQDFVRPPDAYHLINLKTATAIQLDKLYLRVWLQIDNLFNVSYRDYLNRQRYFADDLGINAVLGLSLKF